MNEFITWLAGLEASVVIEFVNKHDLMVKNLLLNKMDNYDDYEQEYFEKSLGRCFRILHRNELRGGTRTLYFLENISV